MTTTGHQSLDTASVRVGVVDWLASNPFGEPTAFLLLHPLVPGSSALAVLAGELGLSSIDNRQDMPRVGTDTLVGRLSDSGAELRRQEDVWIRQAVDDRWLTAARDRGYIVLTVCTHMLESDAGASRSMVEYLSHRKHVHAALVNVS